MSWWPGDGNAYDIIGTNDGTLVSGATFASGEVGLAFAFNGTNFVQASTTGLPTNSDERTLELWANVNSFVTPEAFFAGYGNFGSPSQTYHLGTDISGTTLFFSQWGDAIFSPDLQPNTWYHVAATTEGSTVTLYLNGVAVPDGSKSMDIQTPTSSPFFMGSLQDSYRTLDGLIDEVSVYSRALSGDEIRAIYKAGTDGKCKLPVLVSSLTDLIKSLNLSPQLKNLLLFYVQKIPTVVNSLTTRQKQQAIQDLNNLIAAVQLAISRNHILASLGNQLIKVASEAIAVLKS